MRDYSINYGHTTRKTNKKNKTRLTTLILVVVLSLLLYIFRSYKKNTSLGDNTKNIAIIQTKTVTASDNLTSRLEKIISGKPGSYSVYIYDINNSLEYSINGKMVVTAASINKIPILAALYLLADKKEIDLEKIVVPQPDDIQDYGSGNIRTNPIGTPYSLKTLARLMMQKSDNTASYILATQIIGIDKTQSYVDTWGMDQTNMADNKSSPENISKLFIKMYKGEITSKPLTTEMMDFMSKTDFEDRIPKGLPSTIKYYHKTGDEVGKLHDVAIVELDKRPYYIGVFTMDITDEEDTKNTIAEISKTTYDFMKSL
jgi:beta-lactamase class A